MKRLPDKGEKYLKEIIKRKNIFAASQALDLP
jgi:hypothetical protein